MKASERVVLSRSPLFSGIPPEELPAVLNGAGTRESFPAGSVIPAAGMAGRRLGILLSGTVIVMGTGGVPLNRLGQGGMFGAAALFGKGEGAPTHLIAKKDAEIFFLSEEETERLTNEVRIRRNLIAFLCDRIRFLNRKVATFSAADSTEKVAMALAERAEDGQVAVASSLAQLARSLDMGRASLYRALSRLEERGEIRREGKKIILLAHARTDSTIKP